MRLSERDARLRIQFGNGYANGFWLIISVLLGLGRFEVTARSSRADRSVKVKTELCQCEGLMWRRLCPFLNR